MVWILWWYSLLLIWSDLCAGNPKSRAWSRQPKLSSPTSPPKSPRSPPGPKPHFYNPQPFGDVQQMRAERKTRRGGWNCTLWPGAAVIYSIHPSIGCPDSDVCNLIMRAFQHYEEQTCVRFKARSGERDYVMIYFDQNQDSTSVLGRHGGQQPLTLNPQCLRTPVDVIHELGHVLGLPDEVTRPDRDKYIRIDFAALREEYHGACSVEYPAFPVLLEEPFDYDSVMIYGAFSASKDGRSQTIFSVTDRQIIQREKVTGLSDGDISKISRLYRCQGVEQNTSFPFDVTCSFGSDECGFNNMRDTRFGKWFRQKSGKIDGGFMFVDSETSGNRMAKLLSVNFHGLSPIDYRRGPTGCVMFSYFISSDSPATLNLSQTQLDSPHQNPEVRSSRTLWSQSKAATQWDVVKIPVNIERPFMVVFGAQFTPGTKDGLIGLGDFVLTYTPCNGPGPSSSTSKPTRDKTSKMKTSREVSGASSAYGHKAAKRRKLGDN